jgi:hypothetical protein
MVARLSTGRLDMDRMGAVGRYVGEEAMGDARYPHGEPHLRRSAHVVSSSPINLGGTGRKGATLTITPSDRDGYP